MSAAMRTVRPSGRTIFRANSSGYAVRPRIRFHDLRHSVATILLQQGFSLKQIQEWLGHADIATTANVYAHVPYVEKISIAKGATPAIVLQ